MSKAVSEEVYGIMAAIKYSSHKLVASNGSPRRTQAKMQLLSRGVAGVA